MGESEAILLLANRSAGHAYPAAAFADSWWKVLFCQFHDMLVGASLYSDYEHVRDSLGYACEVAETSKVAALETMAKQVDLSVRRLRHGVGDGVRHLVFESGRRHRAAGRSRGIGRDWRYQRHMGDWLNTPRAR